MSELLNHEEACQKASENGFEVIKADDKTLCLDLDSQEDIDYFYKLLPDFIWGYKTDSWSSKSGKGLHVVITLYQATPLHERQLMQAFLGSDRKREYHTFKRFREGGGQSIVLFKPKKNEALISTFDDYVPF